MTIQAGDILSYNGKKTTIAAQPLKHYLKTRNDVTDIARDAIEEIRKMEYGSVEYEEFIGKYLSGCIDITKIQNDCVIPTIYEPVCGCDGFTYSNSAEAQCNGVLSFENGKCD